MRMYEIHGCAPPGKEDGQDGTRCQAKEGTEYPCNLASLNAHMH